MAKKIDGYIKLNIPAGAANPSPPVGPALGQRGINIMEFCKAFNAATEKFEKNMPIPVIITVFVDKSFSFVTKTPPVSYFLKKAAGKDKASSEPGRSFVGKVSSKQVREIAENKMTDLNAANIDGAIKMIERAKETDPNGNYVYKDLMEWEPKTFVDMIHSMEVIYYFNDPKKLILHMKDKWLKPNGKLIMGLDFYKENSDCHDWPKQLDTQMTLLSINQWVELLKNCGLKDVISYKTNTNDSFEGTLVLYAKKWIK